VSHLILGIQNPDLEEFFRMFLQAHADPHGHQVRRFVESRLHASWVDKDELATWIYHWSRLRDRDKVRLISQLGSSNAYHYLQMLQIRQNKLRREEVISELARRPNPALDEFLIDSYHWYRSPQGPGYWSTSLARAILATDTPRIREFLLKRWNQDPEQRVKLLHEFGRVAWDAPHLGWFLEHLSQATTPKVRRKALPVLRRMARPEAWALVESWAKDGDAAIRKAALAELELRQQQQEQERLRQQQAEDLIAGKIKPDGLLPRLTAYVWNGGDYVPELAREASE